MQKKISNLPFKGTPEQAAALDDKLIAAWTGCDANDTRMILHTHALIGEILAFRLGKETILLRTGWTAFDEEKTELINQTVTCHIDLILQGLSQRSL